MYSSIRRLYQRKRHVWHERRADLFVDVMRPVPNSRILDLGGGDGEFMGRVRERCDVRVTVADINQKGLARASAAGYETVQLVEGAPLPFDNGSFDIVFCNSVIEHVTLPKSECFAGAARTLDWTSRSLESQRAFASEIQRIGRHYFVQTPHRSFPIESHTWLPFVGWLNHDVTAQIVRVADRMWVKQCGYADWNLLDEHQLRQMFPGGAIHIERMLALPKSLIVYR